MSRSQETALAVLAVGLVVILLVDFALQRTGSRLLTRLPVADQAVFATRYRLLRRVSEAVIVFLAVIIVLWSFDQTRSAAQTVLASSAVLGLVVGFAARSTLANFVAGVMIAINQPLRLGDRVAVDDAEGTVEDVGLTYTRLRTADNRRVLIPNEDLTGSRVVNLTLIDPVSLAQVRISTPVNVDAALVRDLLAPVARELPGRLAARPVPEVTLSDLTGAAAVFSVAAWVPDPADVAPAQAWMREQAQRRLSEAGLLLDAGEVAG